MSLQPENELIRPSDLPSPPQTALKILQVCSQEDVKTNELVKLVANDPILSAEILRVVNSPYFGISKQVGSIKQAIIILGHKTLHNLALCISTRDVIKQEDIPGFAIDLFWEDSLRRASCARLLAQSMLNVDPDECFTAGLLQDFGLLVMFYLNKDKCHLFLEFRQEAPDVRYRKELDNFYVTHDAMMQNLASAWGLPDWLSQSLGHHHKVQKDNEMQSNHTLSAILYCSDWLSAVYCMSDTSHAIASCRHLTSDLLGLDVEYLESLLVAIPEETEKAAVALGLRIGQQADYEKLMLDANVKLAEENLDYQKLNWKLEQTLSERAENAIDFDRELALAAERQREYLPKDNASVPVTGEHVTGRGLPRGFYDYTSLGDGRFFFTIGEITGGGGINSAMAMARISSLFRCLGKMIHDLPRLMTVINKEMFGMAMRDNVASVIAGIYDPKAGTVNIINAGHEPILLLKANGEVETYVSQYPALGALPDVAYRDSTLELQDGCLYLYSEAVVKTETEEGKELGLKGLLTQLLSLRNKPVKKRLEEIATLLSSEAANHNQDITLLAVEKVHK